MAKDFILTLYSAAQTVFSFREISFLFPEIPYSDLKSKVAYFVKAGKLKNIRKGIYVKEGYNPLELVSKIYIPSYISLETVLQKEGIIFQADETIFAVSYLSRKITVDSHVISYRQMAENIIINKSGIEERQAYFIATKERAFLDAVFLYKNYYFDNLRPLNWDSVFTLLALYQSKSLEKRVKEYYQQYQSDNAK